ncbi:MAG: anthranilate phosphoribosyltransferase [Propionibacteriaceae bacterium]|nr:anthranilate phosphoribosyltransferase [Micropruina sp.]HBX80325.1 anthranilate phosphoribosyltransferase [Propionibacteriaceae bacterium]HBY22488.1 anthranilate phosphoribosyltransferase [Propionibacteriaceae bacterium]
MTFQWPDILTGLVQRRDLTSEQAAWAMGEILSGNATPIQIAGFAVALRSKGESVEELAGLSQGMLQHATPINLDRESVDVVGSGGDRSHTVNVSTMAGIVAAAAGARVVKHGNRAASSACGTADCLEALGVALTVPPAKQGAILDQCGIVFLFAAAYHPALRHAAPARSGLGIATTFNFLGPLANPARPRAQAVGVADARMAALMADVMAARGDRGLVFRGTDGLDELTTTTTSDVWVIGDGRVTRDTLDPRELGLVPAAPADLVGGDPAHNAGVVRQVMGGATGPVRDIVLLNAAATLLAYAGPRHDVPVAEQLRPQLVTAAAAIDSGAALALVDRWAAATQAALA